MKTAGQYEIVRLKINRFEITLNNLKIYIFSNSIALLMAVYVKKVLHQISC